MYPVKQTLEAQRNNFPVTIVRVNQLKWNSETSQDEMKPFKPKRNETMQSDSFQLWGQPHEKGLFPS